MQIIVYLHLKYLQNKFLKHFLKQLVLYLPFVPNSLDR